MTLARQDVELFYQLWLPMLDYVNKKYRIEPKLGSTGHNANRLAVKVTADYVWSHIQVIDEYLSDTSLPKEHAQIIAGWKQCKPGRYIVERHLKKGSVFISEKNQTVYMVKGLASTWEEMVGKTPVLLEATLLPFRDSIISDGLVVPYPVQFGTGIRQAFDEIYLNAKTNNEILYSLIGSQPEPKQEKKKETVTVESYVISVSYRTGCYRHIQIGANDTLFDLHKATLKAFDFDDDPQHAFFMDNDVWSPADAYVSQKTEFGSRLTKRYPLKKLKLEKGKKFKYLFDYEAQWVFQCKVLRELKEITDIPGVIKSVGEPPDQYADDEDEEEFSEEMLQELLKKLPLSKKQTDDIHAYMIAGANLYGLVSLYDLYRLYNSQNPKLDAEAFLMAASVFCCSSNSDFFVVQKTEKLRPTLEEDMKDIEIASMFLFLGGLEENARELRRLQKGKPLKIFPKEEFLRHVDSFYFPETPQRSAMLRYLGNMSASLPGSPLEYCNEIQGRIVWDEPLQNVLNMAKEDGLTASSKWDMELFCKLFQDLNNTTYKYANRGYTPGEMRSVLHPEKRPPAGQMNLFDLESPRLSQTITGTPARNAPCPCGSGKKYKNCCGKT